MLVAVCDQFFGTSTSSWRKMVTPFSFPISAVRFSHSTASNGEIRPSVKKRSNFNPVVFSVALVSVALPCITGFTVAAILFLPAPGSSLDAGGTLLFYYPPQWMKCAFYLVLFMSLTNSLRRESQGGFSLWLIPTACEAGAVLQATANVNELPSAVVPSLA